MVVKFMISAGDRMLGRLMPGTTASAAPDCWVNSRMESCGNGKYRSCKQTCCTQGGCTAWTCGGCAAG